MLRRIRPKRFDTAVSLVAEHVEPPAALKTAVLFLVFNRPSVTRQVFEAIRRAQPPRLYIAADGPRVDHPEDAWGCAETRKIATQVDWPCELETLFRDKNLGCHRAVSGALDWFFATEEMGIILEDDCLPNYSFFWFCQELLERFKNDRRIMAISGNNFQHGRLRGDGSYYFSRYPHCWGWASWKRAWQYFDRELSKWPALRQTEWLLNISSRDHVLAHYWKSRFDRCFQGEIDSWGYRWLFSCWLEGGLSCLPNTNLVSNIGFNSHATHTKNGDEAVTGLPTCELRWPLVHPKVIQQHSVADRYTERRVYKITRLNSMASYVKQQLTRLLRNVRELI